GFRPTLRPSRDEKRWTQLRDQALTPAAFPCGLSSSLRHLPDFPLFPGPFRLSMWRRQLRVPQRHIVNSTVEVTARRSAAVFGATLSPGRHHLQKTMAPADRAVQIRVL